MPYTLPLRSSIIEQQMLDDQLFLKSIVQIATQAGKRIQEIYDSGELNTTYKSDESPVTRADLEADNIISKLLRQLTPNIPIISEESLHDTTSNKLSKQSEVWIVDPLDGTKDFIKHNGEFTVNIALIYNQKPILGVIYAPTFDHLYFASAGHGSFKQIGNREPERIISHPDKKSELRIITSRSHPSVTTERWVETIEQKKRVQLGSSLKLCYLAESKADIYPKLDPIMEWDIAAGDIILREAGGIILETDTKSQPTYNKTKLHQPNFIAFSNTELGERFLEDHWTFKDFGLQ